MFLLIVIVIGFLNFEQSNLFFSYFSKGYDAIRLTNHGMTVPQMMQSILAYITQVLLAITFLQNNPLVNQRIININGQQTTIQRNQMSRLLRSLVILEHIQLGLQRGILVSKRGVFYFYLAKLGKEIEDSYSRELKRTMNSLAIPRYKLFSIEKTTSAFGELVIMNDETEEMIDFSKNPMLDMSILEYEKWKIIGSGDIKRIIVVEKASIYGQMIQTGFNVELKALVITDRGFSTLQGKGWLYNLRVMLGIKESECYGVGDYGPYGWQLLHAYYYVKNPIESEKVLGTRLRIVVTPALMHNFPEAMDSKNIAFNQSDLNTFKFLLDTNNKFFEQNGKVRMNQLKKMYERNFKCDLDLLDTEKLLEALVIVIKSDKTI